jgi:hypothetical protein
MACMFIRGAGHRILYLPGCPIQWEAHIALAVIAAVMYPLKPLTAQVTVPAGVPGKSNLREVDRVNQIGDGGI